VGSRSHYNPISRGDHFGCGRVEQMRKRHSFLCNSRVLLTRANIYSHKGIYCLCLVPERMNQHHLVTSYNKISFSTMSDRPYEVKGRGVSTGKKGKVYFPANRQLPNLVGEDLTNRDIGYFRNRHQHIGTFTMVMVCGSGFYDGSFFFCSCSLFPTGWTIRVGYAYLMYPMDLSDPW
jgi:hypothetical protein